MSAKKNNKTYLGPNGPTQSVQSTFGINTARIANSRSVLLKPQAALQQIVSTLNSEDFAIGRHTFGEPTDTNAQSIDAFPGVPTKSVNYVVTNRGDRLMSSQTKVSHKISNGRTQVEIDLPYYDREALQTLTSAKTMGAIAPLGSFKVKVEVLGGGILSGTDAAALLKVDVLLAAMVTDAMNLALTGAGETPTLAAASHGIMPLN